MREIVDSARRRHRYNWQTHSRQAAVRTRQRPQRGVAGPCAVREGSMSLRRALALSGSLLLSGCVYNARERTDQMVCDLATHPMDVAPPTTHVTGMGRPAARTKPAGLTQPAIDVQTSAAHRCSETARLPAPEGIKPSRLPGRRGCRRNQKSPGNLKKQFKIPTVLPGGRRPGDPEPVFERSCGQTSGTAGDLR